MKFQLDLLRQSEGLTGWRSSGEWVEEKSWAEVAQAGWRRLYIPRIKSLWFVSNQYHCHLGCLAAANWSGASEPTVNLLFMQLST
jgi:hypothetical protein